MGAAYVRRETLTAQDLARVNTLLVAITASGLSTCVIATIRSDVAPKIHVLRPLRRLAAEAAAAMAETVGTAATPGFTGETASIITGCTSYLMTAAKRGNTPTTKHTPDAFIFTENRS